jgi:hypothetical protein
MVFTSPKEVFQFSDVELKFSKGGGLSRRPAQAVGVDSVAVDCFGCGHSWRARAFGVGSFDSPVGRDLLFTCPQCGASDTMSSKVLMRD